MLLVMAFSITPKRTVHALFGCHDKTVTPFKPTRPGETSISKDGFHCACEYQEFQTAFISSIEPQFSALLFNFSKPANVGIAITYHSADQSHRFLRGPPPLA